MAVTFLTNEDKQELLQRIAENGSNDVTGSDGIGSEPKIENTNIGKKCEQFAYLMCNAEKAEGFIFFTDPHLAGLNPHEDEMHRYLKTLKTYYDATPTSFIVCGGDWLEDGQTQSEACYKLGYASKWMRANFDNYYPVIGNHDDNSYGINDDGDKYTVIFSMGTVRNLMGIRENNLYYSFDGIHTKGYVLNSSGEEESDAIMNAYRWEQIDWLAEKLKSDDAENSALFIHAGFRRLGPEAHERTLSHMTSNLTLLCQAYNNGTTVTLNEITYDFSNCTGCVRYLLSGHMHNADGVETHNGIPVISTYDMRMNGVETFDLCMADYDKETLYMVRVGSGSDRIVPMGVRGFTGNVFTITMNLTNCTSGNGLANIREGEEYANTITVNTGCTLSTITVTMGGVDITDTVYSNGEINIDIVTGDIAITASATKIYTNLADPTSDDWSNDGFIVDGEFQDGEWWHEGYAVVTNFIPIEKYDIVRFKGFDRESLVNGNSPCITFFDENKEYVAQLSLRTSDFGKSNGLPETVVEDENGVTTYEVLTYNQGAQFTYNDVCNRAKYFRINALRTVPEDEIIITVNEEIYPSEASPDETPSTYTNLVPQSLDEDGVSVYNSPYGYKNGYVLSGKSVTSNANSANCVVTGFIELPTNSKPIYIKGSDWDTTQNYCRFYIYSTIGSYSAREQNGNGESTIFTATKLGEKYWRLDPLSTWGDNPYYCRISLWGNVDASAGEELIITIGEPIE